MIYQRFTDCRAAFATSSTRGADGFEEWPLAYVRASGFDGGFSGITRPVTSASFPMIISCNSLGMDTPFGTPVVYYDEFDWYLSQRTDVAASQYLTLSRYSASQSGTVVLGLTSLATTRYPTIDEDALVVLFKHCHLYVQRRDDKAIQWVDLLKATTTRGATFAAD